MFGVLIDAQKHTPSRIAYRSSVVDGSMKRFRAPARRPPFEDGIALLPTLADRLRRESDTALRMAWPTHQQNGEEVLASCENCAQFISRFHNRWQQITKAYYAHGNLATEDAVRRQTLLANVPPQKPGGLNKSFDGCLIQPLACSSCFGTLAFKCIETVADKLSYKGRVFYRLSRIRLSTSVEQNIKPVVDRISRALAKGDSPTVPSSPSNSPGAAHDITRLHLPTAGNFNDADAVAVEATNNGSLSWKEAHENWTQATRLTLSPIAFAKRILDFGGGKRPRSFVEPRSIPERYIASRPHSNGGFPPANLESLPATHAQILSHDSLARQREDINRIDEKLNNLHKSVNILSQAIGKSERQQTDRDSIELLIETVSKLSAQISDVDGLRLATDAMKRRLNRLEESMDIVSPSSPAQNRIYTGCSGSLNDIIRLPSPKRQRISAYYPNEVINSPPVIQPSFQSGPEDLPIPTQNGNSSATLHPHRDPNRLVNAGYRKRRGRPRKRESDYRQDDLGTPPWERSSRQSEERVPSPHEHYLATFQSTDRGRVIRRGTGGGVSDTVKRRRKPVRNSAGILLRKDGKPDQRSISSLLNLQKGSKKSEEHTERRPSLLSSVSSPAPQVDHDSYEQHTNMAATTESVNEAGRMKKTSQGHDAIMKQMFPHGLSQDANRLNHAANLFSPFGSPENERMLMLPRNEMQREGLADSAPLPSTSPTKPLRENANSLGPGVFHIVEPAAGSDSLFSATQTGKTPGNAPAASDVRAAAVNESQESYRNDHSSDSNY